MTARKRKENESFTAYRATLKKEARAEKHRKGNNRWQARWGPYVRKFVGELHGAATVRAGVLALKGRPPAKKGASRGR